MENVIQIGDRLKSFREYLGKNQKEFSNMVLISQQSLSKYENGSLNIPDKVKVQLFEIGVNITWLLTGTGEMLAVPSTVGERLKRARLHFPYDESMMAMFMGISENEYKAIENNEVMPTVGQVQKLQGNTTISRHWVETGKGSMLDYESNPPSADDPVVRNFIKAHGEIYRILNAYRGLKRELESYPPVQGQTGSGCSLCDIVNQLDTKRQMKAEGYLEGLLHEQEAEHEDEIVNSEEVG